MPPLITLTTDFGTRDAYLAAMKGTLLAMVPEARLVDISHEIAPQDVMEAAFVLRQAFPFFPAGTVHLVVVDPGVGTLRRALALQQGDHRFVGPDNGLFSLLFNGEPPEALVVLDKAAYWRVPVPETTFHGRDVFAPVAAHLAAGRSLPEVGTPVEALLPLHWPRPVADAEGMRGWVLHIDRFGNCITNIAWAEFETWRAQRRVRGYIGNTILRGLYPTYGAVAPGEPLLLFNSSRLLEVAVHSGDAAALLGIRKGDSLNIVFEDER